MTQRKRISRAREAGRLVEVYSDASHKLATGAWAGVIVRRDRPTVEASGRLKGDNWRSELSELRAAANALHAGFKAGLIAAGDLVVIRSDNQGAVRRIASRTSKDKGKHVETAEALRFILALAEENGFEVTAAWVQGHQPETSADPHAVHNRRCDTLCKRVTGARGGRGPVTIEEQRRTKAVQSSRARAVNAAKALEVAARLGGR